MLENRKEALLEKANSLPLCPGVYIMRDKNQNIIYVGKSRKLKNRVSQYFQHNKKDTKTSRMVSSVNDFDYILCKTEIEALTLENSLIKQHTPKYNIRLKDAKSYPYIKITNEEYPRIIFTRTRGSDSGKYYGPFSGSSIAYSILDILHKSLGIPNCKRRFPQDIGKERPCIYHQMKQCCGLCTGNVSKEEYLSLISCAGDILKGNIKMSKQLLEEKMYAFALEEKFEAAARCRDTIRALERLNQKQSVVASPEVNMDVFGFYTDEVISCMSVMYIRNGAVADKSDFVFNTEAIVDVEALASYIAEHYMQRDYIPSAISVSFDMEIDDIETLETFLSERCGRKVHIKKPVRGANKELAAVVAKNAEEKARQTKMDAQKDEGVLVNLAKTLKLETVPERIEAYDISNIGAENITAGMVVYEGGKSLKSDYRIFKIKTVQGNPDDYMSMREAIRRRIKHLKEDSTGAFSIMPDLILIDGGKGHIAAVKEVLREENIEIPIFGMVKDDFHKTRALCTDNEEISIAKDRAVFMLIYSIQEEVHRFTVGKTMASKRSTMKHSSLEKISGIGPSKAKKLLEAFGTLTSLKNATKSEIQAVKGISEADAIKVYEYFSERREDK